MRTLNFRLATPLVMVQVDQGLHCLHIIHKVPFSLIVPILSIQQIGSKGISMKLLEFFQTTQ